MEQGKQWSVKFHFPYAQVSLDKVPGFRVEGWTACVKNGKVFEVQDNYGRNFLINPALLTYLEYAEYRPF